MQQTTYMRYGARSSLNPGRVVSALFLWFPQVQAAVQSHVTDTQSSMASLLQSISAMATAPPAVPVVLSEQGIQTDAGSAKDGVVASETPPAAPVLSESGAAADKSSAVTAARAGENDPERLYFLYWFKLCPDLALCMLVWKFVVLSLIKASAYCATAKGCRCKRF